jgi:hypothetical protein
MRVEVVAGNYPAWLPRWKPMPMQLTTALKVGCARACGVADAEGPDAFHIEIGSRHDTPVPGEGEKPPIGHVHGEVT